jgi:hypothetical protein
MAINGLVRAVVTDVNDPSGGDRVRVSFPGMGTTTQTWAFQCRSCTCQSSIQVGSTVWVAFENGSQGSPVVLGAIS